MDNITVTWRCKQCGTANDSRSCECEECGSDRTTGGSGSKLRSLIGTAHVNSHTGPNHGVIFNQPQIVVNSPTEPEVPKEPNRAWQGFKNGALWSWLGCTIGAICSAIFSLNIKIDSGAEQFMQAFLWGLLGAGIGFCVVFLILHITELWRRNSIVGLFALITDVTAVSISIWFITSVSDKPLVVVILVFTITAIYCVLALIATLIFCMIDRS
jgi:hypothetical protein